MSASHQNPSVDYFPSNSTSQNVLFLTCTLFVDFILYYVILYYPTSYLIVFYLLILTLFFFIVHYYFAVGFLHLVFFVYVSSNCDIAIHLKSVFSPLFFLLSPVVSRNAFTATKPDPSKPNMLRVGLAFGTTVLLWAMVILIVS